MLPLIDAGVGGGIMGKTDINEYFLPPVVHLYFFVQLHIISASGLPLERQMWSLMIRFEEGGVYEVFVVV